MQIDIREEKPEDINAIRDLVYHAFLSCKQRQPGQLPMEHLLIDRLRKDGLLTLSLVAFIGDILVGHITFSKVYMTETFCNWYGLGPLAVQPEFQHNGIGSALVKKGIEMMKAKGADGLVVLGDPKFYRRFGFEQNPKVQYVKGMPEFFLILPFNQILPVGCVSYEKPFDME